MPVAIRRIGKTATTISTGQQDDLPGSDRSTAMSEKELLAAMTKAMGFTWVAQTPPTTSIISAITDISAIGDTRAQLPNVKHPITFDPAEALRKGKIRLLLAAQKWQQRVGEQLLDMICNAVTCTETQAIPPFEIFIPGDGSTMIEWQYKRKRIGFSLENRKRESFWYYIDLDSADQIRAKGPLGSFDAMRIVSSFLKGA
jgi:hypothetical protein